jgi:hypothetical protein
VDGGALGAALSSSSRSTREVAIRAVPTVMAPPATGNPAGERRARNRSGTQLRSAGYKSGRNARTEKPQPKKRKRCEHQGERRVHRDATLPAPP